MDIVLPAIREPHCNLPLINLQISADKTSIFGVDRHGLDIMVGYTSSYWLGQKDAEEYARLFAASSNLLVSLTEMAETFGQMFDNIPEPDECESDAKARAVVSRARVAIAKAGGKQA